MSPKKPYAVVFAGVPGTSKTPISNYLSWKFGLGILNADQLRAEVKEDFLVDNINVPAALAEFEKRYKERSLEILSGGQPIIFDGAVDRRWSERKEQLQQYGYAWFLVDMNLTLTFLDRLFRATKRAKFIDSQLPAYMEQHEAFRAKYAEDISLTITDETFSQRVTLAAAELQKFIDHLAK